MRRLSSLLFVVVLVLASFGTTTAAQVGFPPTPQMLEYVVELDWEQDPQTYSGYFMATAGVPVAEHDERVNHIYRHAINGFSVFLTSYEATKAERAFSNGGGLGIKSFQASVEVTVPVLEAQAIATNVVRAQGDVTPTNLLRSSVPVPSYPTEFASVDVAVIDTGVDKRHSDLNVVGGIDCVSDNPREWGIDEHGHGTHVAGTIAARYDGDGILGYAPGVRIQSVRVLDGNGYGSTASVLCGIDYVAANPQIAVANMSLGASGSEPSECGSWDSMHNAICVASENTVFVVAAGNSAQDASTHVPASYDEVLTVGAFADYDGQPGGMAMQPGGTCSAQSIDDEYATFSNYGDRVDIAAPGVCILSTLPITVDQDGNHIPNYGVYSGTSMASPAVAGALARFLAKNPDQRDFAVQQLLMWSNALGGRDYRGCHAEICPPLLFVGSDGIPRYSAPIDNLPPPPVNISR